MADYIKLKEQLTKVIEDNLADLIVLNDDLADNPELSGKEYRSSEKIVELLKKKGFETEYPFAGLETSFKAVYGKNNHKYKIAIMTEYDALPGIGHACGHCVSGSISVLAGIALTKYQDELNADIHVIGTPNEEGNGAKATMVKEGVFDGYDMAIMVHLYDQNMTYVNFLALNQYIYTFHGKAAHASAAPEEGVNALNAVQLMFHAVDMLRQHVTDDVRMHGVVRNGGEAPNIVPEAASCEFYFRAADRNYLNGLLEKIDNIAKGAALCTGCTYDKTYTDEPYDNLKHNETGNAAMSEVFEELGLKDGNLNIVFGSSDAGNVSFVCPTFHPCLQMVDKGVAIHTREFADGVKSDRAHKCIATGAQMIALHIAKIFTDEAKIKSLKEDFNK